MSARYAVFILPEAKATTQGHGAVFSNSIYIYTRQSVPTCGWSYLLYIIFRLNPGVTPILQCYGQLAIDCDPIGNLLDNVI